MNEHINPIMKDILNSFLPQPEDRYVSNCCGAEPVGNGDNDTMDYGICPDCGEHCEYIKESELEDED